MSSFSTKTIISGVAGIAVAGAGLSTALVYAQTMDHTAKPAATRPAIVTDQDSKADLGTGKSVKLPSRHGERKAALPGGTSTGTSFWDPATASGKPMSYHTLASPYWPLGTVVKITYGKKSAVGVVEDFGPAEWAVAQHNPPAIVDLSEKMMADLTGTASNSVTVHFQVLKLGHGAVYRHDGTGYDMATGISSK
jgi:hypothetical protein